MHDACLAISRGELDVVLVTGAEAMYARALRAARPGPALAASGPASRRGHRPPGSSGWRRPAPPSSRCNAASSSPCTPTPSSRTRSAPPTAGRSRSTRRGSAPSGPASARSRPAIRTPGSAPPARPTEIDVACARQPDGVVPLPEVVHRQHAGRPGRRLHRVLGGGGACGRGARGTLGLPPRRCGRQRPLVHLRARRAAPLSRHPAGRRGRARAGRARHRRRCMGRPLLVLPRRGADGSGRAAAWRSTIRTAPSR